MSKKPSLYNATKHLTDLMERIDNADDLTTELISDFSSAKIDVADAIDRRRFIMSECDSRIDAAKKMTLDIKDHIKRLEKVKERIKTTTLNAMQMSPDTTYRDSLGREIKIKIAAAKLQCDLQTKKISIENCLDTETSIRDDVREYVEVRTYYLLNVDKVKEDLKNEINLKWARLIYSEYLKGL